MHRTDIAAFAVYDRMILGKEEDIRRIIMTPTGAKAVAAYYYEKYKARIVPVEKMEELEKCIQEARDSCKDLENARIAFLVGFERGHIIPVVYIKTSTRHKGYVIC